LAAAVYNLGNISTVKKLRLTERACDAKGTFDCFDTFSTLESAESAESRPGRKPDVEIDVRYDLIDCGIDICSVEVFSILSDVNPIQNLHSGSIPISGQL